jgi:hypothetical protein
MRNTTEAFYSSIPAFSDFASLAGEGDFFPLPEGWRILVADIASSLKSVEAGRYQDVNLVGAACVVAAQNVLGGEFPYSFGGDGATFAVSPECAPAVLSALEGVRRLAEREFGIELRVGAVDVSELRSNGSDVLVGRFRLKGSATIAMFRGGGVAEAERRVKSGDQKYTTTPGDCTEFPLESLSCRWSPIPTEKGTVLTLIVTTAGATTQAYSEVLAGLERVLHGNIDSANPVHLKTMRYATLGAVVKKERRFHRTSLWRSARFFLGAVVAVTLFGSRLWTRVPFFRRYAEGIKDHCDYRKFDDALRLVLDCTHSQVESILDFLEGLHRDGRLFYGAHQSDSALMTCFVRGMSDGEHFHFIDGGDGGYALAAKGYKEQLRAAGLLTSQ